MDIRLYTNPSPLFAFRHYDTMNVLSKETLKNVYLMDKCLNGLPLPISPAFLLRRIFLQIHNSANSLAFTYWLNSLLMTEGWRKIRKERVRRGAEPKCTFSIDLSPVGYMYSGTYGTLHLFVYTYMKWFKRRVGSCQKMSIIFGAIALSLVRILYYTPRIIIIIGRTTKLWALEHLVADLP